MNRLLLSIVVVTLPVLVWADTRMYRCELGLQAGVGYYVGDATRHIFTNPLETFGGQFRYKFDKRWALQVKVQRQRITFREYGTEGTLYYNPMWHTDVTGEFNFFRFGERGYDIRVKPITPYIFIGLGFSVYNEQATASHDNPFPLLIGEGRKPTAGMYIPLGIGMKWKFADRWQLQVAWQHQIYFRDNIEGISSLDGRQDPNTGKQYGMNGTNILNNDLTSTLTLGIVFEFAKEKKVCNVCR